MLQTNSESRLSISTIKVYFVHIVVKKKHAQIYHTSHRVVFRSTIHVKAIQSHKEVRFSLQLHDVKRTRGQRHQITYLELFKERKSASFDTSNKQRLTDQFCVINAE